MGLPNCRSSQIILIILGFNEDRLIKDDVIGNRFPKDKIMKIDSANEYYL
jgi:hypothetical protein